MPIIIITSMYISISKNLLLNFFPLFLTFCLGAKVTAGQETIDHHRHAIETACRDTETSWPACNQVFSTFLLQTNNDPLVGDTTCDNSCTFSTGLACASKVANCVSPCTSDPTSSQCLLCVANLGSCCNCLAYTLGKVSNSVGQAICNECPAAALQVESIKDPIEAINRSCNPLHDPNCSFLLTFLHHGTNQVELGASQGPQPLLGGTPCDNKCSWGKALRCAGKVAKCVPKCLNGLTNNCRTCVVNSGSSCCNCAAYAVGKASSRAGSLVCNFCSSNAVVGGGEKTTCSSSEQTSGNESLLGAAVLLVGAEDDSPTLADLLYSTEKSAKALLPSSDNYSPNLQYVLGCAFYDIPCFLNSAKCGLCKKAVPALIKLGSKEACTAGCVVAVEGIGGGPGDPVADIVAVACPVLCTAVFSSAVGGVVSADRVCQSSGLC